MHSSQNTENFLFKGKPMSRYLMTPIYTFRTLKVMNINGLSSFAK